MLELAYDNYLFFNYLNSKRGKEPKCYIVQRRLNVFFKKTLAHKNFVPLHSKYKIGI